jgi:hypothetical protein
MIDTISLWDEPATVDVIANTQLVLHEREARDRGWWRQMHECYHADAEVHVAWFEGTAAAFTS